MYHNTNITNFVSIMVLKSSWKQIGINSEQEYVKSGTIIEYRCQ